LDQENTDLFQRDREEWDRIFQQLLRMLRAGVVLCVEQGTLSQQDKDMFFISGQHTSARVFNYRH
jgi:hypothetical protein